jgi:hypothetical protein
LAAPSSPVVAEEVAEVAPALVWAVVEAVVVEVEEPASALALG